MSAVDCLEKKRMEVKISLKICEDFLEKLNNALAENQIL
jgi:hypothetical protein